MKSVFLTLIKKYMYDKSYPLSKYYIGYINWIVFKSFSESTKNFTKYSKLLLIDRKQKALYHHKLLYSKLEATIIVKGAKMLSSRSSR